MKEFKLGPDVVIKGPQTKSGLSDDEIQERLLRREAERQRSHAALEEVKRTEPLSVPFPEAGESEPKPIVPGTP